MNPADAKAMWMAHRHHKKALFLLIVLILLVCWLFGPQIWMSMNTQGYQAVFLTNGQVYFGKLSATQGGYKLTNIYYLQVTQALQQASAESNKTPSSTGPAANTQPNIQLIKLGNELHGPTDAMYLGRQNVLFWENMKNDSKVVDAINKYNSAQK